GLLEQVGTEALRRLLPIPWAAAGTAEARHHVDETREGVGGARLGHRRTVSAASRTVNQLATADRTVWLPAMARVEVSTTPSCPYCVRAKRLLEARAIAFAEIDVSEDDDLRADLVQRTGRQTVPQIFIDGRSIGGFEELAALDAAGELSAL